MPNLKTKYGAEWALVTGGSSGIGRAIVNSLAMQKLNIVIVAIDDDLLKSTMAELKSQFPNQEFRSVGCYFSPGGDYLEKVVKACDDIDVQLIFNNAGYIVTSFYHASSQTAQMNNLECNLTGEARAGGGSTLPGWPAGQRCRRPLTRQRQRPRRRPR